MTLNEFMKTNGLTFEDVEKELETYKAAFKAEEIAAKKTKLTTEFVKIVMEYAELFGLAMPEEDKEEEVKYLTFILAPALEEAAKSWATTVKQSTPPKTEPVRRKVDKAKELDEIMALLGL